MPFRTSCIISCAFVYVRVRVCACVQAVEAPTEPIRQPSLWVECGGDSGLLAGVFESEPLCPVYTSSSDTRPPGGEEEEVGEEEEEEKDVAACSVGNVCLNEEIEGLSTAAVFWNVCSKVCRMSRSFMKRKRFTCPTLMSLTPC